MNNYVGRLVAAAPSLLTVVLMLGGCSAATEPLTLTTGVERLDETVIGEAIFDPSEILSIESIRLTAAGHFIDLRYRVHDPDRANELLGPGIKPQLIDEASGIVMEVPMTAKLGLLRQTQAVQRPDRTYFVLFANDARLRSGSRVTAKLGDLLYAGLTVD